MAESTALRSRNVERREVKVRTWSPESLTEDPPLGPGVYTVDVTSILEFAVSTNDRCKGVLSTTIDLWL